MNKYDALDNAILTAIVNGSSQFYLINAKVEHLAKPHAIRDPFRVVDRRLQALRKRGLIEYGGGSWSLRDAASSSISKEKP